jgi:hypothetical protein
MRERARRVKRVVLPHPPTRADDHGVSKVLFAVVVLALFSTVRCYNADLAQSLAGLPVVGAMLAPPPATPKYVAAIGKPAATKLPETDLKKWFPTDATAEQLDPTTWTAIRDFVSNTGTQGGWAEACKLASTAAGTDRAASPALGALACSADPAVTALQPFATAILGARAEVALWIKGAPGASIGAIQGRQGELRILCQPETLGRLGGAAGPFGQACVKALDLAYLSGNGAATFTAMGEAYTLVATELAARDPKTAAAPTFFGDPPTK